MYTNASVRPYLSVLSLSNSRYTDSPLSKLDVNRLASFPYSSTGFDG